MSAEPSVNDLSPLAKPGIELEPMLLLDTTGSMSYANSADGGPQRRDIVHEAMASLVSVLAEKDSQAEHEAETGAKDMTGEQAGGLMTATFAGGTAVDCGDFNPGNLARKWAEIRWGGHTEILPGWNEILRIFNDEFGDEPVNTRPKPIVLVITDGEADDTDQFAAALAKQTGSGGAYVVLAILGYGDEHDRALAEYQRVAAGNPHIRVVTFGNETNPDVISDGLLSLISND